MPRFPTTTDIKETLDLASMFVFTPGQILVSQFLGVDVTVSVISLRHHVRIRIKDDNEIQTV